ncbi:hypothetical protein CY34DRAFT_801255 [Suillus luteus UH-Slu-Lm8-n1]|uniref:Uncharacterized protein n=1 Tax=Suillus luteus UH-Slu-Lm8-n1 TaxID=930992 RepID=A0A0D0B753_9AGAM|nr:hypothetical protein CY34DRAFT_801255 [Suillus luteus UH-Slu-Lm8-n1]
MAPRGRRTLEAWWDGVRASPSIPLYVICLLTVTDAEAYRLGRFWLTSLFESALHYHQPCCTAVTLANPSMEIISELMAAPSLFAQCAYLR